MAIRKVKVEANECICEMCAHRWVSLAELPPAACPNCKSRSWNGTRKVGRPVGIRNTANLKLPKPHRPRTT
jgi:hypothetical protein